MPRIPSKPPIARTPAESPQRPESPPASAPLPGGIRPIGAGDLPHGGPRTGLPVGVAGLTMQDAHAALATKSHFELLPGRYPDAVGLPEVLRAAKNSADAQALVKKLAAEVETTSGLRIDPKLLKAVKKDPSKIADLLTATPAELSKGIDALNLAHAAGKLPPLPPMPAALPSGFDLGKLDATQLPRPEYELKKLGPGLWMGDVKNTTLDDAQASRNMAVAEVFDRLAGNASKPAKERFAVRYGDSRYTRLDSLVERLGKEGHEITVSFEHRVANFANLKTKAPDGTILDVPAALLVKTGLTDANGREALLPAVHSEVVIRIRSTEATKGPKVDADIKWYQGISGTGFFPCDLSKSPAWCGATTSGTLSGAKAREAIGLAGLTSDLINASAKALGLAVGGYGATGVCNDSVAVVQHAMTGSTACYPLLMRDDTLKGELAKRLSDANHGDDPEYTRIGKSIAALPSDVTANDSARTRAREGGLPGAAGKEPFQITVDAREILAP